MQEVQRVWAPTQKSCLDFYRERFLVTSWMSRRLPEILKQAEDNLSRPSYSSYCHCTCYNLQMYVYIFCQESCTFYLGQILKLSQQNQPSNNKILTHQAKRQQRLEEKFRAWGSNNEEYSGKGRRRRLDYYCRDTQTHTRPFNNFRRRPQLNPTWFYIIIVLITVPRLRCEFEEGHCSVDFTWAVYIMSQNWPIIFLVVLLSTLRSE